MAVVACPSCEVRLKVPDEAANGTKKIKCPRCGTVITPATAGANATPGEPGSRKANGAERETRAKKKSAPAVDEAEVDEEEEEEPAKAAKPREAEEDQEEEEKGRGGRRLKGPRTNWRKIRSGLSSVYQGVCLQLMALPIFCLIFIIAIGVTPLNPWLGGIVIIIDLSIVGLLNLGAIGLTARGLVLCLQSPPDNGAKSLALVNLCLFGAATFLSIAGTPLIIFGIGILMLLLAAPVSLAWAFVCIFFLRALALDKKAKKPAASMVKLAVALGISIAAVPLLLFLAIKIAPLLPQNPGIVLLLGVYGVCGGWGFALVGWFLSGLTAVLDAIEGKRDGVVEFDSHGWMPLLGANALLFAALQIFLGISIATGLGAQYRDELAKPFKFKADPVPAENDDQNRTIMTNNPNNPGTPGNPSPGPANVAPVSNTKP